MQIPPVSAAKQNGAGSDLVLNDCLAYLRFGRYCPFLVRGDAARYLKLRDKAGHYADILDQALLTRNRHTYSHGAAIYASIDR